jgi:hypothetical protein
MTVTLPPIQLDRKLYQEVAKRLELIGGKWTRQIKGFQFKEDPSQLLSDIASGQPRNIQKEFQFFGTPSDLADELVSRAAIQPGHTILEPSAGQGAIVEAILRVFPDIEVDCYELMEINRTFLVKIDRCNILGDDFLLDKGERLYDRIIANPPFSKNADVTHIKKMYSCLAPGGRIVTMASRHWEHCNNRVEREFRRWLDDLGAVWESVPEGTFKESGTLISTNIISIDK